MPSMAQAAAAADTRNWRDAAACRDVDPELFFPTARSGPAYEEQVDAAKSVCASCSVRTRCLDVAMADPGQAGVAGGLDEHERRAAHKQAKQAEQDQAATGSASPSPSPSPSPEPSSPSARSQGVALHRSATLEPRVAALIAAHAPDVDHAKVRALALGEDPTPRSASRQEVALAALARLSEGEPIASTARVLEVDGNQVRRWRDREVSGEALVQGEGAGPYCRDPEGKFAALSGVPSPRTPTEPTAEPAAVLEDDEAGEDELGDEEDEPEPAASARAGYEHRGAPTGGAAPRPSSLRTARRTPRDGVIAAERRPSTAPRSLRQRPAPPAPTAPAPRPGASITRRAAAEHPRTEKVRETVGDALGRGVAAVLEARVDDDTVRAAVDPVVVRGLVEASGPAAASRWETAVAAAVLFEQGQRLAAVARRLSEPMSEVRAWRRRYDHDEPLILGGPGVGLQQVPRPAHLVATSTAAPVPAPARAPVSGPVAA